MQILKLLCDSYIELFSGENCFLWQQHPKHITNSSSVLAQFCYCQARRERKAFFFLLTCRHQDHKVNPLRRLVTIPITPTGITDHGVIQAGGEWREKQELCDMINDPLLPHTKRLSFRSCQLTKKQKFLFHHHHIQRRRRTHDPKCRVYKLNYVVRCISFLENSES